MTSIDLLITGATGNIGRALRRTIGPRSDVVLLGGVERREQGVTPVDLFVPGALAAAIREASPRVVVHLASVTGAECDRDPDAARRINVEATGELVDAARVGGVSKIVFASTAAVYGDVRRRPVSELDRLEASGTYATTKQAAEERLEQLASSSDCAVDVLRIFNVYGPGMADSLVNRLIASVPEAPVPLAGLDQFVRDYVHVDDVAAALVYSVADASRGFRVLNIGSGVPRSNRDVLAAVSAARPVSYVVAPERSSFSCADIAAARRDLGFHPRALEV